MNENRFLFIRIFLFDDKNELKITVQIKLNLITLVIY